MIKNMSPVPRCIAFVKDNPGKVNLGLCVIVFVHFLLDRVNVFPHVWGQLDEAPIDERVSVYLAEFSVSASVACFTGIVVVFGLSSQPEAFRQLRVKVAPALTRNWLSLRSSGFVSAAFAMLACLMSLMGAAEWAPWFFELSVFSAHMES